MAVVGDGLGGAVGEDDCELAAGEHPWVAALAEYKYYDMAPIVEKVLGMEIE